MDGRRGGGRSPGGCGRAEEAIALPRPHAQAEQRLALAFFGCMHARHGRDEEASALLRPHVQDRLLADALVDVAEGMGRVEEAAALLRDRIEAGRRCGTPACTGQANRSPCPSSSTRSDPATPIRRRARAT
ncbi:hypothetical protein [Kitasatospora sp. NPDC051914]|uniref:hypothetical protein n=1 Tax=Kitasatospora sp. NPDC051914 TaxID=3154945 RepID=UPI003424F23E